MLKNKVSGLSRTHNQSEKQWLHRDEPPIKTMKTNRNLIPLCLLGAVACLNPLHRAAEVVSQQWNVINPPATLLDQSQQQGSLTRNQ